MNLKGKLFFINKEIVYKLSFTEEHCTIINQQLSPGIYLIVEDHFDVFCSIFDGNQICLVRYDAIKNIILDDHT